MPINRIIKHPILEIPQKEAIEFIWQGKALTGYANETIASALIANGIYIFGHHQKDNAPMGIFCANGQCSQCMVIANGFPVKACMELIQENMMINPVEGSFSLPKESQIPQYSSIKEITTSVLIIGGGPAGLSAAIELGKAGVQTIIIDDKTELGGKLVLQTHRFFGSTKTVYAGTRGIKIAHLLANEIEKHPSISYWLNSTALAVFSDNKIGILKNRSEYILVKPAFLLVACGAREKFLAFPGNTLPGVMGAGAFQTLVNINLVLPAKRLLIIGGGNVGLIAGYHAIQAGIEVAGLIEIMSDCGGYKVHKDKLQRLGVPIFTSHTILSANGHDHVESVTIAKVNQDYQPILGSERTIACDCVLVAVGLDPIDEFFIKAREFGLPAAKAGDADEVAEASAAIFSGKIRGYEIINYLNKQKQEIPADWVTQKSILASKPGQIKTETPPEKRNGVYPVFHCNQEIPCDPCAYLCPLGLINIDKTDIRNLPIYKEATRGCSGCLNCVAGCPGLAITLVDYRIDSHHPTVTIPAEFSEDRIKQDDLISVIDTQGSFLMKLKVKEIIEKKGFQSTRLIKVIADASIAEKIAGFRLQNTDQILESFTQINQDISNDTIICRCERISAGEIRRLIKKGYRDLNEIKTISRAGMGSCGGKTCQALIIQIMKQSGIQPDEITQQTKRPLFIEVPMKFFAGIVNKKTNFHDR